MAVVVLTGGGIKGAVAGASCAGDQALHFVHVDYGQVTAGCERSALAALCGRLRSSHAYELRVSSARINAAAAQEHHGEVDIEFGMKSPSGSRGLLPAMVALATPLAARLGARRVVLGISQVVDESQLGAPPGQGRPDRRREFMHAMRVLLSRALGDDDEIELETPLIDLSYAEILRLGVRFQIPFEFTWTCEAAGRRPCTRCESCRWRQDAFSDASFADPQIDNQAADPAPAPA